MNKTILKGENIEIDFLAESIKLSLHNNAGDCHNNSRAIASALKKLGYDVRVCSGVYVNLPKKIKHSWIEFKDKILETDCKQLREECDKMPNEFSAVLDKNKFIDRYIENGN